jgi:large subunit ribosomal protein L21
MSYAIISVGGKQYRVQEGERLFVDRLAADDGETFSPTVLLVGGEGDPELAPKGVTVTARVLGRERGPKIRIGKHRQRTGYRRHTGFRAALTQIEIESIGGRGRGSARPKPEPVERAPAAPKQARASALPDGFADMTVAEIKDAAGGWGPAPLRAALEHERAHGKRKGAIAALESALAAKETES